MTKCLNAFVLILSLLLTMSGCSTVKTVEKIDIAGDKVEVKLDAVEDLVEERIESAVESVTETSPAVPILEQAEALPESVPAAPAESKKLTKEQAQQIALDHVGLSADQVTRLRTEYEIDDRIPQFDVEFHQGNWEYEFEIHAEDGTILSFDKDDD